MRALIYHFVPKADDAFIATALSARGCKPLEQLIAQQCAVALGSNLEAMRNCMDADDHEDIAQAVKAATTASKSTPTVASDAPKPAWTKKPIDESKTYDLKDARELIPNVVGCSIRLDQVRFSRWIGIYPRTLPPFFVTKVYGPTTGMTSSNAMFFVIERLWAWHSEASGEDCPLPFSKR